MTRRLFDRISKLLVRLVEAATIVGIIAILMWVSRKYG